MTEPDLVRNPQAEAAALAGPTFQPRVLEPSPPAVVDDDWFADDPVAIDPGDSQPLLPHGLGEQGSDWTSWLKDNPQHASWVRDRWLGGDRALPPAPSTLVETRLALHRLAAYVIAPERHRSTGKFGLRWTLGGFGTPFFGTDRQIRVVGDQLIDQQADSARTATISTLQAAADFLDAPIDTETAAEHDSPAAGDANEPLAIDVDASDFLGSWFAMGFAALERVRADHRSIDASRPQIWPGHFDPAIEVGDDDHRGSYGASPGDQAIDEPYLYVSVWWPDRIGASSDDPVLNAPSFTGAILRLSDFGSGDPVDTAYNFFTTIRDHLQ